MSANILNGQIDPKAPASLSSATVDGLLRGQLGWSGPVVTDDLSAVAITSQFTQAEAIALAIEAGNDLLTFCQPGDVRAAPRRAAGRHRGGARPVRAHQRGEDRPVDRQARRARREAAGDEHDIFWQELSYRCRVRASRLVSVLLLLQARGGLTASELAAELEVSERTIHRDVEALSASGVPIYAERGPHGGIRLVDGYRTRLTGMTGDEAEALFLAGLPGPAAELGLGTVVAAAQLKVLASLPPELRTRASRLVERFHLDAGEWFRASQPVPHLGALSDAVWGGTRIAVQYERGGGPVRRVLDPLGLVLKAGTWYVVAVVEGQIRTYRVSRVVAAEPTGESFERPAGFDLAAYWLESSTAYERDAPRIDVIVRVRPDRVERLHDAVGNAVMTAAERLTEPDPEGWLRFRLRLDWPDEAAGRLLAAGRWVEVLSPPEIRARVANTASAIAARYAGDAAGDLG